MGEGSSFVDFWREDEKPDVFLGLLRDSARKENHASDHVGRDGRISLVGGQPSWLIPPSPSSFDFICPKCRNPFAFVCQIYTPYKPSIERVLYIFGCHSSEACWKEESCWLVLRQVIVSTVYEEMYVHSVKPGKIAGNSSLACAGAKTPRTQIPSYPLEEPPTITPSSATPRTQIPSYPLEEPSTIIPSVGLAVRGVCYSRSERGEAAGVSKPIIRSDFENKNKGKSINVEETGASRIKEAKLQDSAGEEDISSTKETKKTEDEAGKSPEDKVSSMSNTATHKLKPAEITSHTFEKHPPSFQAFSFPLKPDAPKDANSGKEPSLFSSPTIADITTKSWLEMAFFSGQNLFSKADFSQVSERKIEVLKGQALHASVSADSPQVDCSLNCKETRQKPKLKAKMPKKQGKKESKKAVKVESNVSLSKVDDNPLDSLFFEEKNVQTSEIPLSFDADNFCSHPPGSPLEAVEKAVCESEESRLRSIPISSESTSLIEASTNLEHHLWASLPHETANYSLTSTHSSSSRYEAAEVAPNRAAFSSKIAKSTSAEKMLSSSEIIASSNPPQFFSSLSTIAIPHLFHSLTQKSLLIDVVLEPWGGVCEDAEDSDEDDFFDDKVNDSAKKLLERYLSRVKDGTYLAEDEEDAQFVEGSWAAEEYEAYEHKIFARFQRKMSENPHQILRYCFGGKPLLMHEDQGYPLLCEPEKSFQLRGKLKGQHTNKSSKTSGSVGVCKLCGSQRAFELQILPNLYEEIGKKWKRSRVESESLPPPYKSNSMRGGDNLIDRNIRWGSLLVYTCANDCLKSTEICTKEEVKVELGI